MRPSELLEVYIEVPVAGQAGALSWVNFTDGLINTNVIRGVNEYQGPWIQPNTGQLVLSSRNNQLDPEFNSQIRNKRRIKLIKNHSNTQETLFIGRISGIDVKYQPRNSDPVITITAFDILAELSKRTVTEAESEAFYTYPPVGANSQRRPSCAYLLQYMNANTVIPEIELGTINVESFDFNNYPDNVIKYYNKIEYGKSYYDALAEHARGNNGFFFAARDGKLNYRWRKKPTVTPAINFDSRDDIEGATPYIDLNLVDGYDRVYNNLTVNSYEIVPAFPPIPPPASKTYNEKIQSSIDIWGDQPLTVDSVASTLTEGWEELESQNGWLYESAYPHREISEITWKGTNDPDLAATTDIGNFVNIYYEYGTFSIDRQYQIVGIKHEINANEWLITYQLRNWDFKIASTTIPIISSNRTSTDQATPIQFNLVNYGEFFSQVWNFGDGTTSTLQNPTKTYASPGTYTVTCTGTNDFGQVGVSDPITIAVSFALPVISGSTLRWAELNPSFTHSNVNGQYYFWADQIQYETKNDWGFHFAVNPERRTTTNDVYPIGPFQIMQRSTDTVLPGNKVSRTLRLQSSNVTGTANKETAMDLNLCTFNTQTRSARYILVRRYSSQSTYKYQASSTLDDCTDVTRIKNIRILDSNQNNIALNKPVVAVSNNNGFAQSSTLTDGEFSTWNIATQPNLITDGNDTTFARFTTNLGPYTANGPKGGAAWLCQPDHYFIIDLGSVMSFTQINIEFSNEEGFPRKEQTPVGTAGSRGNVGYQVFYGTDYPATNGFGSTYHAEYKAYPFIFRNTTFQGHFFPVDTCVASKLPIN